jgi:hypothetical protein
MKRLLIGALTLALCLTGCATPAAPSTPSTDPTTTAAATTATTAAVAPTTTVTEATTAEATTEATEATTTEATTTTQPPKPTKTTKKKPAMRMDFPVYTDPKFESGVLFTNTANSLPDAAFSYSGNNPCWLYTQERSLYNLGREGVYTSPAPGVHQYQDTSKLLYIDTNTGEFRLDLLGSEEYLTPREANQQGVGSLMSPRNIPERIMVKDISALYATLDFELTEVTNHMSDEEFNVHLHTAMWNYYIFVQDSKSNDWFYVGLPLYDWRNPEGLQTPYVSRDYETGGTFVYVPDSPSIFGEGNHVEVGVRFACDVDMLPLVKEAFRLAQERGFFAGKSLNTFYISGCNLGWEIPGTFDGRAVVYQFDLTYME